MHFSLRYWLLALLVGGFTTGLMAQEVISGPLTWVGGDPAPETAPTSNPLRPSFPLQSRETDEIGYVLMRSHVGDNGGQLGYLVGGSEIAFENAVREETRYWKLRPAIRGGHPIASFTLQSFIFNPRSAAPHVPKATPRLLAVTPIYLTDFDRWNLSSHPVIRVTLNLDEAGKVTQVTLPPGSQLPADPIRTAIKEWQFAPAREAGQPVPATVTLNAVLTPPLDSKLASYQAPKLIKEIDNGYPSDMLWSRMNGEVTVGFTVNELGVADNILIAESNNPGFEDQALQVVHRSRFKPALINGQPAAVPQHVKMTFSFPDRNLVAYVAPTGADLPEPYRYDVAPKPRGSIQPVFPYDLLIKKDYGEATVAFTIGTDGRVHSTRVMKATRPEYGWAVAAAVAQFRFDPALRRGKPITTISSFHHEFNGSMQLQGIVDGDAGEERGFAIGLQAHPQQIVAARLLDAPLRAFSRRAAVFPPDLATTIRGTAVVRIIVDETGHARLPRLVTASDPAFGYAAVQAAQYWRFDPPTARGKPVMTIVEVPFTFAPGS
jgi:TonB family protein